MPSCIPINCTLPPFPVRGSDLGMYNFTEVEEGGRQDYATAIKYWCPREGWGYPSNGHNETTVRRIFNYYHNKISCHINFLTPRVIT